MRYIIWIQTKCIEEKIDFSQGSWLRKNKLREKRKKNIGAREKNGKGVLGILKLQVNVLIR